MFNQIAFVFDKYKILKVLADKVILFSAQKKYGFAIGTGEHATWNNEADTYVRSDDSRDHGYYSRKPIR